MYRFHWEQLVTDDLIAEMLRDLPHASSEDSTHLKRAVLSVLKKIGGTPITPRILSDDECVRLRRFIINQPLLSLLTQPHTVSAPARFKMKAAKSGPLRRIAESLTTLDINEASPSQLVTDGGLRPAVSESVVNERNGNGPFNTLRDLVARVDGISPSERGTLKQTASFRRANVESSLAASPSLSQTFGDLVKMVRRQVAARSTRPNRQARESRKRIQHRTQIHIAANLMLRAQVHPVPWLDHLRALDSKSRDQPLIPVDYVGMLPDRTYYTFLPSLIDGAQLSISLCMFHVVYSSERHPTRKLLNSLAAARQRGVSVRVLMDQDRKNDPYRSLVINTPAKKFFERNGIECRLDDSARLLHSKYLIIDGSIVVVGSHNWSAGSYFNYRDLSFVVYSDPFSRVMNDRFDNQWKEARS